MTVLFLVWYGISQGDKYRLGMTLSEVKSLTGGRFPTRKFGIEFTEPPTPAEMNNDALYYVCDEDAGIMLLFNHHEVLIQKKRIGIFGINFYSVADRWRRLL